MTYFLPLKAGDSDSYLEVFSKESVCVQEEWPGRGLSSRCSIKVLFCFPFHMSRAKEEGPELSLAALAASRIGT